MAKKKDKKPKGKRIRVAKVKRKKNQSKKKKRRTRGRRAKGQYSNFFPTNRQVDSNQYWQLRAEIAGAEARVKASLRDRQDEESKAEKRAEEKVERLERDVRVLATTPAIQQQAPNITIGQPNITINTPAGQSPAQDAVTGGEYSTGESASANRPSTLSPTEDSYTTPPPTSKAEPEPQADPEYDANSLAESQRSERSGVDFSAFSDISDDSAFQRRLDVAEQQVAELRGTGSADEVGSTGIGSALAKFGADGGVEKFAQKRQAQHRGDHTSPHGNSRDIATPLKQTGQVGGGGQFGSETVEKLKKLPPRPGDLR